MSKKELLSYLIENNTNISWEEVIIGLFASVVLASLVYFVYKKTYTGVMYSKNFNVTLFLICVITTMVMMIIGSNLALSLGMVGALSIIRFRTAVKEPKDSAFIFWAIAIGIGCGTGIYIIAIVGSLMVSVVLFIFSKGAFDSTSYLLIIHGSENLLLEDVSKEVERHTSSSFVKMKNVTSKQTDLTYEVKIKKGKDNDLINSVEKIAEVKAVNLVTYNGEIAG